MNINPSIKCHNYITVSKRHWLMRNRDHTCWCKFESPPSDSCLWVLYIHLFIYERKKGPSPAVSHRVEASSTIPNTLISLKGICFREDNFNSLHSPHPSLPFSITPLLILQLWCVLLKISGGFFKDLSKIFHICFEMNTLNCRSLTVMFILTLCLGTFFAVILILGSQIQIQIQIRIWIMTGYPCDGLYA